MGDLSELQVVGLAATALLTLWGLLFEAARARFAPPGPDDREVRR